MVRYAARRGVKALGVTLSREQAEWAQKAIADEGLGDLAEVRHSDYRDVPKPDSTRSPRSASPSTSASETTRRTSSSCRTSCARAGVLLNHCITRPHNRSAVKAGGFIDRYVFPDGELTGSGRIITEMQNVGFEVRHEENLGEHYALHPRGTGAQNLEENWDACVAEVGEGTARVWGLYMAGSRLGFERNIIQLHQVLGVKLGADQRPQVPLRPWWVA